VPRFLCLHLLLTSPPQSPPNLLTHPPPRAPASRHGRRGTDRGGELRWRPDSGAPSASAASSPPWLARPMHADEQMRPARPESRRRAPAAAIFGCAELRAMAPAGRCLLTSPLALPAHAGEARIEAVSSDSGAGSSVLLISSPSSSPSLSFHASSSRLRVSIYSSRPSTPLILHPPTPSHGGARIRAPQAPSSVRAGGSEEHNAVGAALWGKERTPNPFPMSGFLSLQGHVSLRERPVTLSSSSPRRIVIRVYLGVFP
jgi:hypothetical protein